MQIGQLGAFVHSILDDDLDSVVALATCKLAKDMRVVQDPVSVPTCFHPNHFKPFVGHDVQISFDPNFSSRLHRGRAVLRLHTTMSTYAPDVFTLS